MTKGEFESRLSEIIVSKNLDMPSPQISPAEIVLKKTSRHYHGPDYYNREKLKTEGNHLLDSQDVEEVMLGYGLIAYAHYYRSLDAATGKRKSHPEFSEYMSHWLYSDKSFIRRDVFLKLAALYSRPKKCEIADGQSHWGTA